MRFGLTPGAVVLGLFAAHDDGDFLLVWLIIAILKIEEYLNEHVGFCSTPTEPAPGAFASLPFLDLAAQVTSNHPRHKLGDFAARVLDEATDFQLRRRKSQARLDVVNQRILIDDDFL